MMLGGEKLKETKELSYNEQNYSWTVEHPAPPPKCLGISGHTEQTL